MRAERAGTPVSLRVTRAALAAIDLAAASQGRDRTEFMVAAALAAAADQLERERVLDLDDSTFDALKRALDAPPAPSDALIRATRRPPIWDVPGA
jgi:uncharacterized protein (DUF1778 family)